MENLSFIEWLVVALIGLLVAKEVVVALFGTWARKKLGLGTSVDSASLSAIAALGDQMNALSQHFNHETTSLLQGIKDGVEALNRKHEEWEKYGIPTRECEKEKRK